MESVLDGHDFNKKNDAEVANSEAFQDRSRFAKCHYARYLRMRSLRYSTFEGTGSS